MQRDILITHQPIAEAALQAGLRLDGGQGAVVRFLGVVRDREGEQTIRGIDYEAFEPMARRQFELIYSEVEARWPVASLRVVHRVGPVRVNEPSLWVEVVAPHRAEAFAACQYLIDEMKQRVPIWKRPAP